MKKEKHYHKKKALLEFHTNKIEFSTQEAVDFLNSYKSKYGVGLHRYTQTTYQQLGAILSSDSNYLQTNPNAGKNITSKWVYVGEEE